MAIFHHLLDDLNLKYDPTTRSGHGQLHQHLIDGVGAGMYQTRDESDHLLDGALIIDVGGCDFHTVLAVTGELAGTVRTNDWAKAGSPNEFVWTAAQTVYPSSIGSEPVTFLQWIQAGLAARLAATTVHSNASHRSSHASD